MKHHPNLRGQSHRIPKKEELEKRENADMKMDELFKRLKESEAKEINLQNPPVPDEKLPTS